MESFQKLGGTNSNKRAEISATLLLIESNHTALSLAILYASVYIYFCK